MLISAFEHWRPASTDIHPTRHSHLRAKLRRTRCETIDLEKRETSEALTVHNRGARLIILALGDPHLLECAQRGKDGATNPHRVLALWWSHNLNLHGRGRQGCEFFGHTLADASKHCGAT